MGGAAPVITAVAEVVVAVVAPEVIPAIGTLMTTGDTALAGAMLADSAVASMATTEAMVAGGAAVGGTAGALQAAATDKSVGEGAVKGAATGAVTAGVGQALPSDIPGGISGAAKGAAGGFTSSELSGQNLQQSLKNAEIGGITGGITGTISDVAGSAGVPSDVTRGVLSAAGPYIRQDVSSMFGAGAGAPGTTSQPVPSYLTSGPLAGSTVLGAALGGGGTDIGGTYGATISPGSEDKSGRSVWNVASLRETDSGSSA